MQAWGGVVMSDKELHDRIERLELALKVIQIWALCDAEHPSIRDLPLVKAGFEQIAERCREALGYPKPDAPQPALLRES